MSERARLGWVIVYVPAVEDALAFYERAFGLERAFIDPSGTFGQLATGDTALAFAHESLGVGNFAGGVQLPDGAAKPFNVELALVFDDPVAAFAHADRAALVPVAFAGTYVVAWLVFLLTPLSHSVLLLAASFLFATVWFYVVERVAASVRPQRLPPHRRPPPLGGRDCRHHLRALQRAPMPGHRRNLRRAPWTAP